MLPQILEQETSKIFKKTLNHKPIDYDIITTPYLTYGASRAIIEINIENDNNLSSVNIVVVDDQVRIDWTEYVGDWVTNHKPDNSNLMVADPDFLDNFKDCLIKVLVEINCNE